MDILTVILIFLAFVFLIFIADIFVKKDSVSYKTDKEEQQEKSEKRKSIDRCSSCAFLSYIDTYWAQCIVCYKLGQIYPPYACNHYKSKDEYDIIIKDNKYKLTKKENKMVNTEESV